MGEEHGPRPRHAHMQAGRLAYTQGTPRFRFRLPDEPCAVKTACATTSRTSVSCRSLPGGRGGEGREEESA